MVAEWVEAAKSRVDRRVAGWYTRKRSKADE